MKRTSLALLLLWSVMLPLLAQTPTPTPTLEIGQDDDVVRITTNLVQVDVSVTDKNGKIVTDLTAADFEIYEDGKLQPITNFSFVSLVKEFSPNSSPTPENKSLPVPPVRLRPEQVQRTIALVVDDLGLSWESIYYVRRALKKFVDEQMQPGDLVAIIRTAGGMGALQSFTSDKRQLYAAIERVRWYPQGRGGISTFAPLESSPLGANATDTVVQDDDIAGANAASQTAGDLDAFRAEVLATGTLGALNYIVTGLSELPGRKSVLLISDGFRLLDTAGDQSTRVVDAVRRLTDQANRASVVIYTMDARGLQTASINAADDASGLTGDQITQASAARREELIETQNGLIYLADQTGGFSVRNNNDLVAGMKHVLDDQAGYYLIGYRPDDATFNPITGRSTYHKLTIKLKRPGLNTRSRKGFFGISGEKITSPPTTRAAQLNAALASPFGANGVRVRLTSFFVNQEKTGSYIRSVLFINGHDLTFAKQPDGSQKAVIDVLAYAFGDNGQPLESDSRTYTLKLHNGDEEVINNGITYTIDVPVKKPGAYQFRIALRDSASERVGSASQFIEAPDLKKNRLALSGIAATAFLPNAPANPARDAEASLAVRRFHTGMNLDYAHWIYNAKLDKTTNLPRLTAQIKLISEGREVFKGSVRPVSIGKQTDLKRLTHAGRLYLGNNLAPGEYILQIIVNDQLAKGSQSTTTQWIDFELVK